MNKSLILLLLILSVEQLPAQQKCACEIWNEADKAKNEPLGLINSANIYCRAKGYELMAAGFLSKKELDSAEMYIGQSEALFLQSACKEEQWLGFYQTKSAIYFLKAAYPVALETSLKLLTVSQNGGFKKEEAEAMLSVSQIFARMGQTTKGLEYCRAPLPIVQVMVASPEKADLLNKIGSRFYFFFQDIKSPVLLDSAALFFTQALAVAKQISYRNGMQTSYNKMNTLAYRAKNYSQALLYIDSAIAIAGSNETALATSYGDRANIYLKLGDYTEAAKWADSCLALNIKHKFPPLIANAYSLVAEIADSSGDYSIAYYALYKEKKITDSLNRIDKVSAVNEVEKKYNQAKNEKTIKELSLQKQIYALAGIAGLLVAGLIAFYFRQQSLKHKQTILETEQRLNRARMNPHFFFNALTAMQQFAMKENDGRALASSISKFSNIMRETLESTYKEYVTVKQEIDFLKEYLEIQKMRFPELFTWSLMVDGEMEPSDVMIPSMIIQPFIENSIEHGFTGIDYPGELRVDFLQQPKSLLIEIKDNGKGMLVPGENKNDHISRASQIIKDRIYLLNIKLKTKADFSIDNNPSGKGVIVKINLPVIYTNEGINS